MLKFPMGCAKALPETSNNEKRARTRTRTVRMRMAVHRILPLLVFIAGPRIRVARTSDIVECVSCQIGIEDMKVRIRIQRTSQELFGIGILAQAVIDHSSMKQQKGIVCVQTQRLF